MTTTLLGKPLKRRDAEPKVRGEARYTDDLRIPGLLHARLVTSPHAHARIVRIDTRAASHLPGVVAVLTGQDLLPPGPEPAERARHLLARDKVIFAGQPVAVVVADSPYTAADAAELVAVEYEELPTVVDPLEAMRPDAPAIRPKELEGEWAEAGMHATVSGGEELDIRRLPANVTNAVRFQRGDVAQGFASADLVIERTYRTPFVHQSYLEPHASVAVPRPDGGVTIYTSTQGMFYCRNVTATTLGLPHELVTVVPMEVGGGFGGKTVLLEPLVAAVALRLGRPVKLVLTRTEEFLLATPAPAAIFELRGGIRRDGTLTTLSARVIFDSGAYPGAPVNIALLLLGGTYRWEHLDLVGYEVLTNKPGTGAYRAPGVPQATFAVEQLVDELARGIGLDPLEVRLRNASRTGDLQPNGVPWPPIGLVEVLERAREHPLWRAREKRPNEGWGLAIGGWPGGIEPCAANVRLNHDGTFTVTLGAVDITGTHTVLAMIAAEVLEQPVERVRIALLPSDAAPYAGMSGGSKITYTVGLAVKAAAEEAKRQLLEIAASELEAAPEDLELVDGAVQVRGVPDRRITLQHIAALSMAFGGRYAPVYGTGRVAVTQQSPGFDLQIAHVRVDPETGEVHLLDLVAIQDVGRALNPALVEEQVHGGVGQGVGWALHEAMRWDENGRPLNPTFLDYDLPKASHLPAIAVELVEVPSPVGPFGAKGVGEPPVIPTAAAVANAIADAIGVRMTELPITPERVRAALQEASAS
ncbi:xanthine dehydrogenase family protein molybdopterin-binding subunit [Thermomicrobium sp. 4228-Ro]|uniref:xanthine dehydrogenase family protein molybdopterin-binding subunit n=1 Tax=Thermomicrobium sp. 4228-Ro TaxID=2993937 RepID=UPI002248B5A8|nr:xanthine dehydrogenase family protein molybdopterin-binding subunit [Thermomicrobium sp. 4228-Ro]MCX2728384.1 xanthine dehydrogenase family protein molybdopterin-binding subunit [Thermomicrobium sp. 4228-Ro]